MKEVIFIEVNKATKNSVEIVKKLGHKTKLLTYIKKVNPNYYDADQLSVFDEIIEVDTHNLDKVFSVINAKNTIGVLACYDDHVLLAAQLASMLSLPHANIEGLKIARCKDSVRDRLSENGFQQIKYHTIEESSIPLEPPLSYPFVMKPVHEAGSQGVKLCYTKEDYLKAIKENSIQVETFSGYKLEKRWLLEEYVPGEIYGAQMLWTDNEWKLLGVTKEFIDPSKNLVLQGIAFPADFDICFLKNLEKDFVNWANCIGLKFGALDIEFKIVNDRPILIEINPRLAGAMIPKLLELSLEKSVLEYLVKSYCGEKVSFGDISCKEKLSFAQMFLFPPANGVIESIDGLDELETKNSVVQTYFKRFPLKIVRTHDIDDMIGYVIASGKNSKEASDNALNAFSSITLRYSKEEKIQGISQNTTVSHGEKKEMNNKNLMFFGKRRSNSLGLLPSSVTNFSLKKNT